jgi:Glycosyl transferase family 4 group
VGFDLEFRGTDTDVECRLQMKNANYELHFPGAHAGIAPTHWQASLFPEPFASRIAVIQDGIRTDQIKPNATASIRVQTPQGLVQLGRDDEVITFVNRKLEPYRGYHQFMRALPAILKARPKPAWSSSVVTRSATAQHLRAGLKAKPQPGAKSS